MNLSEADWDRILTGVGVKELTAVKWRAPFADEVQPDRFSKGMDDLLAWLPQILHECSMLERLEENLSYSAERINQVWPSRFKTVDSAAFYARDPERLANAVYGGRMGNILPGDGYKYRGRGPIMLTGRDGYMHVGKLIGQDLDVLPELILQPRFGLEAAIAWWEDRIPDSFLSDQVKLRKRVNGGHIGLEHVQALAQKTREVLA